MKIEVYTGTYSCGHVKKSSNSKAVPASCAECEQEKSEKHYLVSFIRRYEER